MTIKNPMTKFGYADAYVSSPEKLPTEEHYAIIRSTSYTDGYGESVSAILYEAYLDRAEWEVAVKALAEKPGYQTWRAMKVIPATTTVKISVNVDIGTTPSEVK